ncbi:pyrimidine/purine nucleoside phosphorylase [Cellulophaga sp. E16_2]|uniref:pyrimidine/purine nucleoside phosphorylase n=1 Tax=Cellulophaga sp. E16_2 TaxID=2789297 RepID=UPI001A9316AD|nr:pyrimidine/purine nucleoside phosphorylase [Cellulophaga sp. E16_2]MBO0593436.1 pyrimidine/purine nucleoside phosphorylase [Cellulophaga sp. E16_2]
MFKTNTYFEDKVISIAFENEEGKATVGVMAPGTYTFGTTTVEFMTVISGSMEVQLKGASDWKTYNPYETFKVAADSSFDVKVVSDTSYKCVYK